jgi:phosphodiesterase/alkaline phosphatase D-like protein
MVFRLKRTYVFDYTANSIERRQGFVVLLGDYVESVGYASDQTSGETARSAESRPSQPAQIIHLQEWRDRPRSNSDDNSGASN